MMEPKVMWVSTQPAAWLGVGTGTVLGEPKSKQPGK